MQPRTDIAKAQVVYCLYVWTGVIFSLAVEYPLTLLLCYRGSPSAGADGFDDIDPTNEQAVKAYFNRHFPDVVPLMPNIAAEFRDNPVGEARLHCHVFTSFFVWL